VPLPVDSYIKDTEGVAMQIRILETMLITVMHPTGNIGIRVIKNAD